MYTSLTKMESLLRLELQLQVLFDRFMKVVPSEKRRPLQSFRNELRERIGSIAVETIPLHIQHPVNAFLLLHRFATSWTQMLKILKMLQNSAEKSPGKTLSTPELSLLSTLITHEVMFPQPEDLDGAASAIYRLQEVYLIPVRVFANGALSRQIKQAPLSVEDCFNLGLIAHTKKMWNISESWFTETFQKLSKSYKGSIGKVDVLEYLAWAKYKLGKLPEAIKLIREILKLDPNHSSAAQNLKTFETHYQEMQKNPSKFSYKGRKKAREYHDYERLCRGDVRKTPAQEAQQLCHYHVPHPSFILKPVRLEYANRDPDIVILKQVMTEEEIEKIKAIAKPKLKRATVINPKTGYLDYAKYRVSKSMWLSDDEDEFLEDISDRLERLTGFDLTTAENLQVVNYGIGGQYEPHWDHVTKYDRKPAIYAHRSGNRIATVLFYMSEVESGGGTAFVRLETLLRPSKGDAALWYNLYKSGESDERTRHAGCPVIVGSKWVSNRWIRETGQEFLKPCGLHPDESHVI